MKTNKIISLLIFSVLLASCQGEPSGQGNDNGKKPTDKTEEQIRPGDPIDVIVTYESVPAVFNADGSPDQSTAWSIASAITAING